MRAHTPIVPLVIICLFLIAISSCTEQNALQDAKGKLRLEEYAKQYGNSIATAGIDGILMLDHGCDYNDLLTTNKTCSGSTHALFVDKTYHDTVLTTVQVTHNGVQLADPYHSGLMTTFVPEPPQLPNSITWVVNGLNSQPLTISDTPMLPIEFPSTFMAGDTVSLSGFSINYSAGSSISDIRVQLIFSAGLSFHLLGDNSTSYPPFVSKTVSNTGTISFTAAELANLRRGYYRLALTYRTHNFHSVSGRTIILAKSYSVDIPLLLQ